MEKVIKRYKDHPTLEAWQIENEPLDFLDFAHNHSIDEKLVESEIKLVQQKKKDHPLDRYGRNAGLELVYTSNKGDVQAWYGHHKSWKYGINKNDLFI